MHIEPMGIGHNHSGHSHADGHGDSHGHHNHNHSVNEHNEGRMALAAVLTGIFMVVEVIGGWVSGSLALLADAGHMLTDFAALSMAWLAFRLARRPADWRRTFGFDRFAILIAFVNGLTLFVIAGFIVVEAIKRMNSPIEVMGSTMMAVAIAGLAVNVLVFYILSGADNDNLNVKAAALHVMGDMLGSVAAIIASIVIIYTGWMPADLIVSVIVALIILRSAWYVIKEAAHILLEGAPEGLDRRTIRKDLMATFPELKSVDHIHAWSICQERPMITLEAQIDAKASVEKTAKAIKSHLLETFGVEHATVEVTRFQDPH
jgi:cobalt-zinc-cadmium efflux system protein